MKWVRFAFGSGIALALGILATVKLGYFETRRLNERVDALEREKAQLFAYAQRLSASRRVAQVDVVRQRRDDRGRVVNTLLWQEIGPDGTRGRPLAVDAVGELVYFEAAVIKFAAQHVGEGDPDRGASLALFRRVFGEGQAPESVPMIAREARPPSAENEQPDAFQDLLWKRFTEMIDDPSLAASYGVRVAQHEAPAVPVKLGQVWEVTLDAAGGLNLKKIAQRQVPATDTTSSYNSGPSKQP